MYQLSWAWKVCSSPKSCLNQSASQFHHAWSLTRCSISFPWLKFVIQSGQHRKKHQRKSMEARKCETGDANQISASMTKSKRTHRKKKHKMSYYPAWNKKRLMYSKLGLRLLGKMPPMVVKPYLVWGQFGSWEASPRRGNEKNLPLLCRKAIRIEPGSVFKKMPPIWGKSVTDFGKVSHRFGENQPRTSGKTGSFFCLIWDKAQVSLFWTLSIWVWI